MLPAMARDWPAESVLLEQSLPEAPSAHAEDSLGREMPKDWLCLDKELEVRKVSDDSSGATRGWIKRKHAVILISWW